MSSGLVQGAPGCVEGSLRLLLWARGGVLSHPAGEGLLRLTLACRQGTLSQEGVSVLLPPLCPALCSR